MPSADPTNPKGMPAVTNTRRSTGEDAYPSTCHRFDGVPSEFRKIEGWGADKDPANRPMIPMELPSDVRTVRGPVEHRQIPRHQVFLSNEMPDLPPVFGESCPPRGLSGLIRAWAFEYGEGVPRHWVALLLADRVDMVESMVLALLRGEPDNLLRERGWPAGVSYATPRRKRGMLMAGAAIAVAAYTMTSRSAGGSRLLRAPLFAPSRSGGLFSRALRRATPIATKTLAETLAQRTNPSRVQFPSMKQSGLASRLAARPRFPAGRRVPIGR